MADARASEGVVVVVGMGAEVRIWKEFVGDLEWNGEWGSVGSK
jgi:hypothetical protein